MKTLNNSDVYGARKQVKDLEVFGDGDMFKLLSKASSEKEGWMKSTKAMEVQGLGCVVQVTTQQTTWDMEKDMPKGDAVAEALCWVPGVTIVETWEEAERKDTGKMVEICIGRKLIPISGMFQLVSPNPEKAEEVEKMRAQSDELKKGK